MYVVAFSSLSLLGCEQRPWCHCHRILLSKPRLVLMDESTSALDTANESLLYTMLREEGITYVSVGHRPTLVQFHDNVLRLSLVAGVDGDSAASNGMRTWEVVPAADLAAETIG
jgi:ABC-type uncharacterized transport system fused permease/ATPase subunit